MPYAQSASPKLTFVLTLTLGTTATSTTIALGKASGTMPRWGRSILSTPRLRYVAGQRAEVRRPGIMEVRNEMRYDIYVDAEWISTAEGKPNLKAPEGDDTVRRLHSGIAKYLQSTCELMKF
jgi:hypothetical protein